MKKLTLKRQTLRQIDSQDLSRAQGGTVQATAFCTVQFTAACGSFPATLGGYTGTLGGYTVT